MADEELQEFKSTAPQNHQPSTLLRHFLFPAASCSFLSTHTTASLRAVSVSFLRSGDVLRLNLVGVDDENAIALGECVVPIDESVLPSSALPSSESYADGMIGHR